MGWKERGRNLRRADRDEGRITLPLSDRYATPGTAFQRAWDCTGTLESLSGAREIFEGTEPGEQGEEEREA